MPKRLVAILALMVSTVACSKDSPTTPTSTGPLGLSVSQGGSTNLTGVGATQQLRATVVGNPSDVTDKTSYVSSDPTVLKVSSAGLVTAVGRGHARVTGTYQGQSDSVSFTVYLVVDLSGTWHVRLGPFVDGTSGTMTWSIAQSGTAITGSFSSLTAGGGLEVPLLGVPATSGTLSGTLSGTYDKQSFDWTGRGSADASNPNSCALSMSGNFSLMDGSLISTHWNGGVGSFVMCGFDLAQLLAGNLDITR